MTGNEIAVHEPQTGTLALRGDQVEWSPVQQAALAHIGIDQAPPADQQVFMHVAQRTRLDPFAKQIYMIPRQEGSGQNRKTKWTIQTGIDGFRLIAERHPAYRGQVGPQWCGDDGEWRDVWLNPQKPPVAARVGILRADRPEPTWGVAMFREYAQYTTYDGNRRLTKMWADKGAHMVAKCAEALALRRAFPAELGGLHTDDEMSGGTPSDPPAHVVRAAAVTAAELTGHTPPRPDRTAVGEGRAAPEVGSPAVPPSDPPSGGDRKATGEQKKRLGATFREAQVDDSDRHYVTSLLVGTEITSWTQLTVAQAQRAIDNLEKLRESGHPDGLAGAVENLINLAEQRRIEAEENAAAAEDQAVTDEAGADQ